MNLTSSENDTTTHTTNKKSQFLKPVYNQFQASSKSALSTIDKHAKNKNFMICIFLFSHPRLLFWGSFWEWPGPFWEWPRSFWDRPGAFLDRPGAFLDRLSRLALFRVILRLTRVILRLTRATFRMTRYILRLTFMPISTYLLSFPIFSSNHDTYLFTLLFMRWPDRHQSREWRPADWYRTILLVTTDPISQLTDFTVCLPPI